MTVNQLYRKYLASLKTIYDENESSTITSIIFEHFAGISRTDLIKDPHRILDNGLSSTFDEALHQLLNYKPVQYVTGESWFGKLKFKVTDAVLIPRPETLELVQNASEFISKKKLRILEIGVGSGCISITLKHENPLTEIVAIDISDNALQIAEQNAANMKCNIHFIKMDFLEENNWKQLGRFDVIISNPPYIPESEEATLDKNVTLYEPHTALYVPDGDSTIFYRKIAAFAKNSLNAEGKIFVETHEDKTVEVTSVFTQHGFNAIIQKDMFEKNRIVIANHFR